MIYQTLIAACTGTLAAHIAIVSDYSSDAGSEFTSDVGGGFTSDVGGGFTSDVGADPSSEFTSDVGGGFTSAPAVSVSTSVAAAPSTVVSGRVSPRLLHNGHLTWVAVVPPALPGSHSAAASGSGAQASVKATSVR